MIEVKGKANIVARILADSVSPQGVRLTTWEVEYPRLIHSEVMTHRMFSRNAASSRAIPFAKMVEQLNGRPVRFGANQAGMQDKGVAHNQRVKTPEFGDMSWECTWNELSIEAWETAKCSAAAFAQSFADAGYHKQITGRLTEPFQMMKTIISATETTNWFWLREDEAADPSIAELARVMKEAQEQSVPELLQAGEYHLPYVDKARVQGKQLFYIYDKEGVPHRITVENAIKVSCARCAAVSYRNEGYGLEKSIEIFGKLLGSDKKHASAFEHVATPMKDTDMWDINQKTNRQTWEKGVSHMDREGNLWSGNFKGFIQFRKTVNGENYQGETQWTTTKLS